MTVDNFIGMTAMAFIAEAVAKSMCENLDGETKEIVKEFAELLRLIAFGAGDVKIGDEVLTENWEKIEIEGADLVDGMLLTLRDVIDRGKGAEA